MTSIAAAAPDAKQLAKDRVTAAEKVFTGTVQLMKAGRATVESAYGWSVRWLEAELSNGKAAKPALADHLARMTTLAADVTKAFQAGTAGATEQDAANYFKLEAELWSLRGKRS
jgi:hypothetical protein